MLDVAASVRVDVFPRVFFFAAPKARPSNPLRPCRYEFGPVQLRGNRGGLQTASFQVLSYNSAAVEARKAHYAETCSGRGLQSASRRDARGEQALIEVRQLQSEVQKR